MTPNRFPLLLAASKDFEGSDDRIVLSVRMFLALFALSPTDIFPSVTGDSDDIS